MRIESNPIMALSPSVLWGMDFQNSKGLLRSMASELMTAASQTLPGCSSSCLVRGRSQAPVGVVGAVGNWVVLGNMEEKPETCWFLGVCCVFGCWKDRFEGDVGMFTRVLKIDASDFVFWYFAGIKMDSLKGFTTTGPLERVPLRIGRSNSGESTQHFVKWIRALVVDCSLTYEEVCLCHILSWWMFEASAHFSLEPICP